MRREFFKIFLLLFLFSPASVLAAGKSVSINSSNRSKFKILSSRYTCYQASRTTALIGIIDKAPISKARRWTERSEKMVLVDIENKKKALKKLNSKKQARQINDLKKGIENLKKELNRVRSYKRHCGASITNSTPNPSPTSSPTPEPTASPTPPPTPSPSPTPDTTGEFYGAASSLRPYRELLTKNEARHFLRKVAFGGSQEWENDLQTKGLTYVINKMLFQPPSEAIRNYGLVFSSRYLYTDDEGRKNWYTFPLQTDALQEALFTDNPFQLRMALIVLHQQFATNLTQVGLAFNYNTQDALPAHWNLLRSSAVGNLNALAKAMVTDGAMSRWLNNEDNWKGAPNQNFSRETLELFILGTIDPFTHEKNYGEDTIPGATAFMSGYYPDWSSGIRRILFTDYFKDKDAYLVFSDVPEAAANTSFSANGWIDHIMFNHPASSRYLAERIGAELVNPDISEEVVIELANDLRNGGFEMKPMLSKLLHSEAMFSQASRKRCLTSPIDLMMTLGRKLITQPLSTAADKKDMVDWLLWSMQNYSAKAGHSIFEPSSVFGWKAACGLNRDGKHSYGEGFITEKNVLFRENMVRILISWAGYYGIDISILVPPGNTTPESIVDSLAKEVFEVDLTPNQRDLLIHFMKHERDGRAFNFDWSNKYARDRKLPALYVFFYNILRSQMM